MNSDNSHSFPSFLDQESLYYETFLQLMKSGIPFTSVTLVKARGSTPQNVGAKMLVTESCEKSPYTGTVGGGKVEVKAIQHAKDLLKRNGHQIHAEAQAQDLEREKSEKKNFDFLTWNLQKDVGMTCGGEVSFFFEAHTQHKWSLAIFGAGHVAQALIPLLLTLRCQVICIDTRQEWLDKLPTAHSLQKIHTDNPASIVKDLPLDSFIICMTHGHATDRPILQEILFTRRPPFLGVIGSKGKALTLKKELLMAGLSEELSSAFFCPVGLPLGDNSPAEIAISMTAQVLQERDRLRAKK